VTTGGRDKSEENNVGEEKEDAKEARKEKKRATRRRDGSLTAVPGAQVLSQGRGGGVTGS
jgi:hypothetical protein